MAGITRKIYRYKVGDKQYTTLTEARGHAIKMLKNGRRSVRITYTKKGMETYETVKKAKIHGKDRYVTVPKGSDKKFVLDSEGVLVNPKIVALETAHIFYDSTLGAMVEVLGGL